jgi:hypothetical protein
VGTIRPRERLRKLHAPPPTDELGPTQDDFFEALATGDLKEAANILRSLQSLTPTALHTLAGLLEGDPSLKRYFPYRLVTGRWGKGQPPKSLEGEAENFALCLAIEHALKTEKKVQLAVAAVAKKTGKSPSTLWSIWSAHNKKTPKNP